MKKHTMKHIVLGLLVAGYSVSSASAVESVLSNGAIQGHEPKLESLIDSTKHTVDFSTVKQDGTTPHVKGDKLQTGDWIVFKYLLRDIDGDAEGSENNTNTKFKVYFFKDGKWSDFAASSTVKYGTTTQANQGNEFRIQVPLGAASSTSIGATVLEKTQFGFPAGNKGYQIPNIYFGNGSLGGDTDGQQPDPGIPCSSDCDQDGGGTNVDTETDPVCEVGETIIINGVAEQCGGGIVDGNSNKFIFEIDAATGTPITTVNYAKEGNPEIGKRYTVVVNDDKGSPIVFTKYTWSLSGSNSSAADAANTLTLSAPVDITATGSATSNTNDFTISANAKITASNAALSAAVAGAQGFTLNVTAE